MEPVGFASELRGVGKEGRAREKETISRDRRLREGQGDEEAREELVGEVGAVATAVEGGVGTETTVVVEKRGEKRDRDGGSERSDEREGGDSSGGGEEGLKEDQC